MLVAMIDKGTYVSQQTYKLGGSDSDYSNFLEQVFLAAPFRLPHALIQKKSHF
jgi:hypothetical protein